MAKNGLDTNLSSTQSQIKKHNEYRKLTESDVIPDNPERNHSYCFINSTIKSLKESIKGDNKWTQRSGSSAKLFSVDGKTVHLVEGKFFSKERTGKTWEESECLKEDVYKVKFHYAFINETLPSGNQLWRRLTEITKLDDKFTTVTCEFYEKSPEDLNRKRKREKKTVSQIPSSSNSINKNDPNLPQIDSLSEQTSELKISGRQTPDSHYSSCDEDSSTPNNSSTVVIDGVSYPLVDEPSFDLIEKILQNDKTLSAEKTLSYEGDVKKHITSGDITSKKEQKSEPTQCIKLEDTFHTTASLNRILGKYVDGCENLGPVNLLSPEGNQFIVSSEYQSVQHTEWKRLKISPKIVTKLWSAPYVVKNDTSKLPFIMFSLENYDNKQFSMRMKLLDCDLNQSIRVPCKFHVEVKVKKSINSDEYTDPVSKWCQCKEIDEYGLELLVPFPDGPAEYFPGLWVRVIEFVESL